MVYTGGSTLNKLRVGIETVSIVSALRPEQGVSLASTKAISDVGEGTFELIAAVS